MTQMQSPLWWNVSGTANPALLHLVYAYRASEGSVNQLVCKYSLTTKRASPCLLSLAIWILQELFETQMGVHQEAIKKLLSMSRQDRLMQTGNCLEGAHLPPRGFYFVKPVRACQLQAQSRTNLACTPFLSWLLPLWRPALKDPAVSHPSGDLELARSSSDEKPADSSSQSGELHLP